MTLVDPDLMRAPLLVRHVVQAAEEDLRLAPVEGALDDPGFAVFVVVGPERLLVHRRDEGRVRADRAGAEPRRRAGRLPDLLARDAGGCPERAIPERVDPEALDLHAAEAVFGEVDDLPVVLHEEIGDLRGELLRLVGDDVRPPEGPVGAEPDAAVPEHAEFHHVPAHDLRHLGVRIAAVEVAAHAPLPASEIDDVLPRRAREGIGVGGEGPPRAERGIEEEDAVLDLIPELAVFAGLEDDLPLADAAGVADAEGDPARLARLEIDAAEVFHRRVPPVHRVLAALHEEHAVADDEEKAGPVEEFDHLMEFAPLDVIAHDIAAQGHARDPVRIHVRRPALRAVADEIEVSLPVADEGIGDVHAVGAGFADGAVRVRADPGGIALRVVIDDPVGDVVTAARRAHPAEDEDAPFPVREEIGARALVLRGEGDGIAEVVDEAVRVRRDLGQIEAVFAVVGDVALLILAREVLLAVIVPVDADLVFLLVPRLLRLPLGASGEEEAARRENHPHEGPPRARRPRSRSSPATRHPDASLPV